MSPIKHSICNDVLHAPGGDKDCADLHIYRHDGRVWSFWTPSPEELAAIVKGGAIALCVVGETHPPLSMNVMVPDHKAMEGTVTDPAEIHALYAANRERCNTIFSIAKRAISALAKATGNKNQEIYDDFLDIMTLNTFPDEVVRDLKTPNPAQG